MTRSHQVLHPEAQMANFVMPQPQASICSPEQIGRRTFQMKRHSQQQQSFGGLRPVMRASTPIDDYYTMRQQLSYRSGRAAGTSSGHSANSRARENGLVSSSLTSLPGQAERRAGNAKLQYQKLMLLAQ